MGRGDPPERVGRTVISPKSSDDGDRFPHVRVGDPFPPLWVHLVWNVDPPERVPKEGSFVITSGSYDWGGEPSLRDQGCWDVSASSCVWEWGGVPPERPGGCCVSGSQDGEDCLLE